MAPKTKHEKQNPIISVRRAAVSLCAFETSDPAATIIGIVNALKGTAVGEGCVFLEWDCARGLTAMNDEGVAVVSGLSNPDPQFPLDQLLTKLANVNCQNMILFAHNFHRFLGNEFVMQSVWNLRDAWKKNTNTLVMLGPSHKMPAELHQDVFVFTEEPPTPSEINDTAHAIAEAANFTIEDEEKIVDATLGYLSLFAVENSLSIAVSNVKGRRSFDIDKLWQLKIQNLKDTAGLEVMLPKETFKDLVGCDGYKELVSKFLNGKEPPRAVLHLDEIEKMVSGSTGGDLSGTSQAILEQFLYWTEMRKVKGILEVGIPGAGKTRSVSCTAGEANVPHLRASMSTVKGGIVGQSEQQMKALLKAVDAVAQGRILMVATCNNVESLAPELMARFKLATFVFDYPDAQESAAIWKYYKTKYELSDATPKNTENWVGREIESCCERAWLFNCTLDEAAKSVVPVCVSNASKMDALRQSVSGRFLSASELKTYTFNPNQKQANAPIRRLQN